MEGGRRQVYSNLHDSYCSRDGGRGCATTMPNEHERETAFLRRCIRYDESTASRQLDERIVLVQRDERCLRRATGLVVLAAALALAGLGYAAVFSDDFPFRLSEFRSQLLIKTMGAVGIGSLICVPLFIAIGLRHRRELNRRRDECRLVVTKLLDFRVVYPRVTQRSEELEEAETVALLKERGQRRFPEVIKLPSAPVAAGDSSRRRKDRPWGTTIRKRSSPATNEFRSTIGSQCNSKMNYQSRARLSALQSERSTRRRKMRRATSCRPFHRTRPPPSERPRCNSS